MVDETERQRIEQEYSKSWEIAEAVYHDVWIVYMDEASEAFYILVQELRAKGYEFWCDCEVETGYLHIMRGQS